MVDTLRVAQDEQPQSRRDWLVVEDRQARHRQQGVNDIVSGGGTGAEQKKRGDRKRDGNATHHGCLLRSKGRTYVYRRTNQWMMRFIGRAGCGIELLAIVSALGIGGQIPPPRQLT